MRNVLLFRPESDMTETVFSVSSIFQVLHSLRKVLLLALESKTVGNIVQLETTYTKQLSSERKQGRSVASVSSSKL